MLARIAYDQENSKISENICGTTFTLKERLKKGAINDSDLELFATQKVREMNRKTF